ncbi:cytochrome c oxidase assembly protein COX16 homolog, mitochondrial [Homalodisca vitripennis]|uniref:cytochrome c oxidase assembly protein COX16 homolog, mitochondrial n=1 Tax=Homalodisca vitripennis TaxID=197043 RepID=UPI001EEBD307|nr:cytochrome c oxidase assembly protein COX16 homolog, mitochondrial [Homalodisca vitripennis]
MSLFNRKTLHEFALNIKKITKSRFVRFGIPFLTLVVGGSFGLRNFTSLRYEYSNKSMAAREEIIKRGIEMKKQGEVTLEAEYEKVKDLDIDNWTNIRGPRPWEEQKKQ